MYTYTCILGNGVALARHVGARQAGATNPRAKREICENRRKPAETNKNKRTDKSVKAGGKKTLRGLYFLTSPLSAGPFAPGCVAEGMPGVCITISRSVQVTIQFQLINDSV